MRGVAWSVLQAGRVGVGGKGGGGEGRESVLPSVVKLYGSGREILFHAARLALPQ